MLKAWIKENPDEVFDTHEQRIYAFRNWIDSLEKYYPFLDKEQISAE
jgi:hypothetical protein